MRSQLTRSVFRRLLSNEGLIFHCPTQSSLHPRSRNRHTSTTLIRSPTRRTLFGFSRKQPRQPKDTSLDPGLQKMADLSLMDKINARAPPAHEIIDAWRQFFSYKYRRGEPVNNFQAQFVLRTFKHLQKVKAEGGEGLTDTDLKHARDVMMFVPDDSKDAHRELAKLFFNECLKTCVTPIMRMNAIRCLVQVLIHTGDSAEARDLVKEMSLENSTRALTNRGEKAEWRCWWVVLSGFARENNEVELLRTYQMMEESGRKYSSYDPFSQRIMTRFYAERDDVEKTKEWYSKPMDPTQKKSPLPETVAVILKFCVRNAELEWGKTIFRELLGTGKDLHKATWDVILQWAAGVMGKGVEDVEHMMKVMVQRNPDDELIRPDSATINGLVELAMSLNDPYLAERYIALGLKSGILPNASTFILQMNYRVDAGDLTGANVAYQALQSEEVQNDEDLPAINKYIRALCSAKSVNYDLITSITSDLDERHKRMEAETVSALTTMYLYREEIDEMVDLLHDHAYHYSLDGRALIRDAVLPFCLHRNVSNARAWDAYTIMKQFFDETDTAIRTKLMNEFFARGRCDMACHVFGHMRQHDNVSRRPVLETYVQCFEGIALCEDRECLDMVHNMLKMDSAIEPNTKLYNALMIAYTGCDAADRALGFWDDITNSTEGPSYNSLEIVFRACGRKPFGDMRAREIWNKMRRMEIEVTREVFAAYVGALAGQGKLDEARGMVESGEKELGINCDVFILGTFYNALPGQNRKDLVEQWAKETYPAIWTELEKLGQTEQLEGHRLFNMPKRVLKA